jgi:hypothetical protein
MADCDSIHMFYLLIGNPTKGQKLTGSGQTKDYEIGICCLSAKHAILMNETKN